jgi:hypothetical protein
VVVGSGASGHGPDRIDGLAHSLGTCLQTSCSGSAARTR